MQLLRCAFECPSIMQTMKVSYAELDVMAYLVELWHLTGISQDIASATLMLNGTLTFPMLLRGALIFWSRVSDPLLPLKEKNAH